MKRIRKGGAAWLCVIQPDGKARQEWLRRAEIMPVTVAVNELLEGRNATVYTDEADAVLSRYERVLAHRELRTDGPAVFSLEMIEEELSDTPP